MTLYSFRYVCCKLISRNGNPTEGRKQKDKIQHLKIGGYYVTSIKFERLVPNSV